jgi:LemA protein
MEALIALGGLLVIVIIIVGIFIAIYNGLVGKRQEVKNAWAQIDTQLKRRYDLIPNLVETAKGYMKHEKETLEAVIKARQIAVDASSVKDQAAAENELTSTLRSLMMVTENYPDLKANENMLKIQEELTSTENKIGFARQYYNNQVKVYNTAIQTIPTNIVANMFNFSEEEYFELDNEEEREAPSVSF